MDLGLDVLSEHSFPICSVDSFGTISYSIRARGHNSRLVDLETN